MASGQFSSGAIVRGTIIWEGGRGGGQFSSGAIVLEPFILCLKIFHVVFEPLISLLKKRTQALSLSFNLIMLVF